MIFTPTPLKGNFVITMEPSGDSRGWFSRFFCKEEFKKIGQSKEWVQANHSTTNRAGTIRGMHFQRPPHAEIKLVKCIKGAVYDVVVDLRQDSVTYLNWFAAELSETNMSMMYIPEGFAHGFQTLHENSQLLYFHSEYYAQGNEEALRYDDPKLNIKWPLAVSEISERDQNHLFINQHFKGI